MGNCLKRKMSKEEKVSFFLTSRPQEGTLVAQAEAFSPGSLEQNVQAENTKPQSHPAQRTDGAPEAPPLAKQLLAIDGRDGKGCFSSGVCLLVHSSWPREWSHRHAHVGGTN